VNGVHDLGGSHGFGRVAVDEGEPFHAEWEKRVFAIRTAMLGAHRMPENLDQARYAIELLPPSVYLSAGYFERWLLAGEAIFAARGAIAADELAERQTQLATDPRTPATGTRDTEQVERLVGSLRNGIPTRRRLDVQPKFAVGDAVTARNRHTKGHTRLPRYVRAKQGVIDRIHGAFDLPERAAVGEAEPEYVYEVRFEGEALWGESAEPRTCVYVQLWESYLEAA
jgi:nitrile hydratase